MSVETLREGPPGTSVPAPAGRAPRWARVLLLAVVVVLVVAAPSGVYLSRYQPLRIGGFATSGDFASDVKDIDGSVIVYDYHQDGITYVTVWLFNEGPLAVRVTGIATSPSGWVGLVTILPARLADERHPVEPISSRQFQVTKVGSRGNVGVLIPLRFGHCERWAVDASMTIHSITVRFRVLGVDRTASLDLPSGIYVPSPADADCPSRA